MKFPPPNIYWQESQEDTQLSVLRVSYSQQLSAAATKKTTIGNSQYPRLMSLVNSASTAQPIGLPLKGAKFCHTSNILLVGGQRCHALSRLFFYSSAVGRLSIVGRWSLVAGCWLLVVGHWSLVICRRSLVLGCWSLVIGCQLLVVGRWSSVVGRSTIRVAGL